MNFRTWVGALAMTAALGSYSFAQVSGKVTLEGKAPEMKTIDMSGVNSYKDGVVTRLYKGLAGLVKSRKITVVEGSGRLVAANAVEVDGTRYEATKALVIATGSYSRSLPGLDIDGERVITSEHALRLERVPSSVIVLGGGVIGVEFASVWKSFGADVTRLHGFLPATVERAADRYAAGIRRAGAQQRDRREAYLA